MHVVTNVLKEFQIVHLGPALTSRFRDLESEVDEGVRLDPSCWKLLRICSDVEEQRTEFLTSCPCGHLLQCTLPAAEVAAGPSAARSWTGDAWGQGDDGGILHCCNILMRCTAHM